MKAAERNGLAQQRRRAYTVTIVISASVLAGTPTEAREMASLLGECLTDETERIALPFMPASGRPTSATGAVRECRDAGAAAVVTTMASVSGILN